MQDDVDPWLFPFDSRTPVFGTRLKIGILHLAGDVTTDEAVGTRMPAWRRPGALTGGVFRAMSRALEGAHEAECN